MRGRAEAEAATATETDTAWQLCTTFSRNDSVKFMETDLAHTIKSVWHIIGNIKMSYGSIYCTV